MSTAAAEVNNHILLKGIEVSSDHRVMRTIMSLAAYAPRQGYIQF